MGYEFWNAKGNLKAAIEVGISPPSFRQKSISAKGKLSASGKPGLHGEARSAGYNVALHSAGLSHPAIAQPRVQAYLKSGIGKRNELNLLTN